MGGQGKCDGPLVFGCFFGLPVDEANDGSGESIKRVLREGCGVRGVRALRDEFASDECSPLSGSRECCLDGVHPHSGEVKSFVECCAGSS